MRPCIIVVPFLLILLIFKDNSSIQIFLFDKWVSPLWTTAGGQELFGLFCPRGAGVTGQQAQWADSSPAHWGFEVGSLLRWPKICRGSPSLRQFCIPSNWETLVHPTQPALWRKERPLAAYDQISERYMEAFTLQGFLNLCAGSTGPTICLFPAGEH